MAVSDSRPVKVDFKVRQGNTFKRALTHQFAGANVDMSTVVPVLKFEDPDIPNLTLGNGLSWGGVDNHILYISTPYTWVGSTNHELTYTYASGETRSPIYGKISSDANIPE